MIAFERPIESVIVDPGEGPPDVVHGVLAGLGFGELGVEEKDSSRADAAVFPEIPTTAWRQGINGIQQSNRCRRAGPVAGGGRAYLIHLYKYIIINYDLG